MRDAPQQSDLDKQLNEARRKRDHVRRQVQSAQERLSQLRNDGIKAGFKVEKLQKQASKRVVNPEQLALPSAALREGGDDTLVQEIKRLMRENKELEEWCSQQEGARLNLEKMQNEKAETQRKLKELREERKASDPHAAAEIAHLLLRAPARWLNSPRSTRFSPSRASVAACLRLRISRLRHARACGTLALAARSRLRHADAYVSSVCARRS